MEPFPERMPTEQVIPPGMTLFTAPAHWAIGLTTLVDKGYSKKSARTNTVSKNRWRYRCRAGFQVADYSCEHGWYQSDGESNHKRPSKVANKASVYNCLQASY